MPLHNFKGWKARGPAAGARGGMRVSAATTAARGATLLQGKPTVSIGSGRGPSTGRSLSAALTRQQQEHWRDLFGRPILRLPTFSRQTEQIAALPLTAEESGASDAAQASVASSPPSEVSTPRQTAEPAASAAVDSSSSSPAAEEAQSAAPASPTASDASSQPPSPQTPAASEVPTPSDTAVAAPVTETGNNALLTPERLQDPVLARFLIPEGVAGFLIGDKGARISTYNTRSGAKVWVSSQQERIPTAGMRTLNSSGTVEQVSEALFMVFSDLTSAEAGPTNSRKSYFKSRDGKLVKARFLAPEWLVGTILGKDARHTKTITAETRTLVRVAPAAGEGELDRLVELAAPDVGALVRGIEEILKLFLRNPKYKAVYIKPGVSAKSLSKRRKWYATTQRKMKEERDSKWTAKHGDAAESPAQSPASEGAQLVAAVPAQDAAAL